MRRLSLQDKRGLTEVIGYVLLIVIAIGLGVLVYAYLELFVPKEKPECPDGIGIIISEARCTINQEASGGVSGNLAITLANKGRFTVDAAYIRMGAESRKIRELINSDNIYFEIVEGNKGLQPGSSVFKIYQFINSPRIIVGQNIIEIEPAVGSPERIALCEEAVISQPIVCSTEA